MGRERWQEMCWSAIRGCRNRKWERAARSTICVITLSKQPRADDKTLLPLPFTQTHLSLSLSLSLTSSLCLCLSLSFSLSLLSPPPLPPLLSLYPLSFVFFVLAH